MKIAVVYNRDSRNVINLFGAPNREKYGLKAIKRITDALKKGGHQVMAVEGDKKLIDQLQQFMPRVLKGERPGMVFNLSYGIQGQARYTHVPAILEMIGLPYVGSGPVAHSLALDKAVAKIMFQERGLPTPPWAMLDNPDFETPDLEYPLIVKPRSEAVSFGIKVVHNEAELREAACAIFEKFWQPVLVERFIQGREINVGILGNNPPQVLPPAELDFGSEGERIYTEADKKGKSGRKVKVVCPAVLDEAQMQRAKEVALGAFRALGCYDCARVDLRLGEDGEFYILEINSLPSLGEHGSYVQGAEAAGLDFPALVNRLVDEASTRYFGAPVPTSAPSADPSPQERIVGYIARRRDQMEKRIQALVSQASRTGDPIALTARAEALGERLADLGFSLRDESSETTAAWLWENEAGYEGGTLLVLHLDVPVPLDLPTQHFRRDPEWLFGDGIGSTQAPLAMVEFALKAVRSKRLRRTPVGVLAYTDEGNDCRNSRRFIAEATARAGEVIVLRPGKLGDKAITQRRGQRRFRLRVNGTAVRLGDTGRRRDALQWFCAKVADIVSLSDRSRRVSVAPVDVKTQARPMLSPDRVDATICLTYPDSATADEVEERLRAALGSDGPRWTLERLSDRPPLRSGKRNQALFDRLAQIAQTRDIGLGSESSVWPSAAGLVPTTVPVVCGLGPVARDVNTQDEAVNRVSLVQRTLLLAEYLASRSSS